MSEQAIAIFCICDELTKCFTLTDDLQCRMTTAEVMTFALIAALHYRGDYRLTRMASLSQRFFPKILSSSRLIRRIHKIPEHIRLIVFKTLQMYLCKTDCQCFIVDSFPIKAYETHKSFRARIFHGKKFHGYSASKKQYFFGIKVHMIIDEKGIPVEFCFTPGSVPDIEGLKELSLEIPEGSILYGDKAYNSYSLEDDLLEMANITLIPRRRKNLKRQHSYTQEYLLSRTRNRIETVFSSIVSRMPRHIRARTEKGFCLKIMFFIIAYLLNVYFRK